MPEMFALTNCQIASEHRITCEEDDMRFEFPGLFHCPCETHKLYKMSVAIDKEERAFHA